MSLAAYLTNRANPCETQTMTTHPFPVRRGDHVRVGTRIPALRGALSDRWHYVTGRVQDVDRDGFTIVRDAGLKVSGRYPWPHCGMAHRSSVEAVR